MRLDMGSINNYVLGDIKEAGDASINQTLNTHKVNAENKQSNDNNLKIRTK